MDTDLIFKRGVAYTLATGTLLGAYFGVIALVAEIVHQRFPESIREWALLIAILGTAAVFDPLKRRIQSWVDKAFDRQKYDYRKALIEFGRGLSSETNLDALLDSIVERLPRTLLVSRVALFLAQPRRRTAPRRIARPALCSHRAQTGTRFPRLRSRRTRSLAHLSRERAAGAAPAARPAARPRLCST